VLSPLALLFVWSFLAATILPIGSEPALVALVKRGESFMVLLLVATIGNYLGACTTYGVARFAAEKVTGASDEAAKPHASRLRAVRLLDRYGRPALILSWVPFVGDAIVAVAGVIRVPFLPFSLWVIAGKAARYAVVIWIFI
jgi:membrane protein YqaA with SNARE-associated domain